MSKSIHEQKASRCVNFNGLLNSACDVGIPYDRFRKLRDDRPAGQEWLPCLKAGECIACESRRWPTPQEIDAELQVANAKLSATLYGMLVVCEDADSRGLGKGNGGRSTVKCPECVDGEISYSVSGYNGHRAGRCSTDGCVSFME